MTRKLDRRRDFGGVFPPTEGMVYHQDGFYFDNDGNHIPRPTDPKAPIRQPDASPKQAKSEPESKPAGFETIDELPDESDDAINAEGEPAVLDEPEPAAPAEPFSGVVTKDDLRAWAQGEKRIHFFTVKSAVTQFTGKQPVSANQARELIAGM